MIIASNALKPLGNQDPAEQVMSTAPLDAASLWRALECGAARIASIELTEHFVMAELSDGTCAASVPPVAWRVLESFLAGESPKCIGFRMGIAPSTVSLRSRSALAALGLDGEPRRAPLFLFMLSQATRGNAHFRGVDLVVLKARGTRQRMVCFPRPDRALEKRLSSAEVEVTRLRVMGATAAEIARERRTALRTVVNQLAASYRKLGVSGRAELIGKLLLNLDETACLGTLELNLTTGQKSARNGSAHCAPANINGAPTFLDSRAADVAAATVGTPPDARTPLRDWTGFTRQEK